MERNKTVALFFASLVLCAVFSAVLPIFGVFSMLVLPAVYGVCLGASLSVPVILSPLPGLLLAGLLWRSSAVAIAALLFLLPGVVLGVCLRRRSSATVISLATGTAYAVIFGGVIAAFALVQFGSIPAALDGLVSFMTSYIEEVFRLAVENDTTGTVAKTVAQFPIEAYVSSLVMVLPGTFLAACEVLGYVLSHIARLLIRMFPVPDSLYPDRRIIALPASVGVLFLVSFVIALFSGEGVVYYVAQNLNTVLCPALFVVGLSAMRNTLRLFPTARKVVMIIFAVMIFLIYPAAGVYSVCASGMISTFADYFRKKRVK